MRRATDACSSPATVGQLPCVFSGNPSGILRGLRPARDIRNFLRRFPPVQIASSIGSPFVCFYEGASPGQLFFLDTNKLSR